MNSMNNHKSKQNKEKMMFEFLLRWLEWREYIWQYVELLAELMKGEQLTKLFIGTDIIFCNRDQFTSARRILDAASQLLIAFCKIWSRGYELSVEPCNRCQKIWLQNIPSKRTTLKRLTSTYQAVAMLRCIFLVAVTLIILVEGESFLFSHIPIFFARIPQRGERRKWTCQKKQISEY